ncbi:MAG TPA: glycosyltransferase family 1 protein [Vicinamibacterales bacterium]|nr:glycosyltransferase family 1 protein [Vicinamibacterales bacterium]
MTQPLRIGIDARELLGATTGVGRYLGELLTRWTARPDRDQRRFVLYTPQPLTVSVPSERAEQRVLPGGRGTWWEQTQLRRAVRSDALDVFFAPAYTAPIATPVPLAVTIHDVSFCAHPEWFRAREGFRRRWLTRHTARRASLVFTDSEFSRNEIAHRLGVDGSKIAVIVPGITGRAQASSHPGDRERMVLFVGSLFNRRRLPDLIAAFALATTGLPDARLVIVGDDRTYPPQDLEAVAAQHGVRDRMELKRYVPDDVLTRLYSRASVFAFLSEYEGFGMTPLEALSAGVPSVVLDTEVAREIYGQAAIFVGRGDIAATAGHLRRLLTDRAAAQPVLERAPDVLARYSWDTAADRTLAHLERIARR